LVRVGSRDFIMPHFLSNKRRDFHSISTLVVGQKTRKKICSRTKSARQLEEKN